MLVLCPVPMNYIIKDFMLTHLLFLYRLMFQFFESYEIFR